MVKRLDYERRSKFLGKDNSLSKKEPVRRVEENKQQSDMNEKENRCPLHQPSSTFHLSNSIQLPAGGGDVSTRPSFQNLHQNEVSQSSPRPCVPRLSKVVIMSRESNESDGKSII